MPTTANNKAKTKTLPVCLCGGSAMTLIYCAKFHLVCRNCLASSGGYLKRGDAVKAWKDKSVTGRLKKIKDLSPRQQALLLLAAKWKGKKGARVHFLSTRNKSLAGNYLLADEQYHLVDEHLFIYLKGLIGMMAPLRECNL